MNNDIIKAKKKKKKKNNNDNKKLVSIETGGCWYEDTYSEWIKFNIYFIGRLFLK